MSRPAITRPSGMRGLRQRGHVKVGRKRHGGHGGGDARVVVGVPGVVVKALAVHAQRHCFLRPSSRLPRSRVM
jgi:hypothetical protein